MRRKSLPERCRIMGGKPGVRRQKQEARSQKPEVRSPKLEVSGTWDIGSYQFIGSCPRLSIFSACAKGKLRLARESEGERIESRRNRSDLLSTHSPLPSSAA